MGLTLLKQLTKHGDKYEVVMVNRGNTYWDRESFKVVQGTTGSCITHCKADRKQAESFAQIVESALRSKGLPLGYVIDFSGFKESEVQVVLKIIKALKNDEVSIGSMRMVKYLFISTDSTYDSSAFLLDQHRHKFVPKGFNKPEGSDQKVKPKLP